MARGGARPGSGFSKGGKAYAGEPNGEGWGGGGGAPKRAPFTAETQPSSALKSAGHITKAMMIERLASKRLELADKLLHLAQNAEAETVQLSASVAILDRLDGRPTQGTPGGDGEQRTAHTFTWGDGST